MARLNHIGIRLSLPRTKYCFPRRGSVRFLVKMPHPASSFDSEWLDIIDRLPPDLDLNRLARETRTLPRGREITDAGDLLLLGCARGPGRMSPRQTVAWARLRAGGGGGSLA